MRFEDEVEQRRVEALERIDRIPIAVLIWGPAPQVGTPVAEARQLLRDTLCSDGHLARFSEELFDPGNHHSILAQQVAQAEAYDIIFSMPDSPGSIAEIHDFARIPGIAHKIVTFINQEWNDGYANRTLIEIQSTITCRVQLYSAETLPDMIVATVRDYVRRLQEFYYFAGRRC
jgi:hypothetical protein